MKADAVYARYSSHSQDDSTSIEVQIQHCERALGGPATHYIDTAKTGRAVAGRSELQRLRNDAREGLVRRVMVWRYSRIGRNLAESAAIIQELEDNGVAVLSAMEGSDPLVRSIFLSMAEHYSRELASNTRDGLIARFKAKAFTGGCVPFGYQVVSEGSAKRLAIQPQEAEIIRQLAAIYLRENIGLKALARRLEQMGVPSRKGARWCHTTLRAILLNSMLVGQVRFMRRHMKLNRHTGRRVPKFRGEADVISYADSSLRILDDATFQMIQQTIESRGNGKSETPRLPKQVRAFTALAYCGVCGVVCYTCKSQNSRGTYYYVTCGNRCRHGLEGCPTAGRVREDVLVEAIRQDYEDIFANADEVIEAAVQRAQELAGTQRDELSRLRGEIAELDRKIASMMALVIDPEFDATAKRAVSRQMGELEQQREQLQGAIGRLAERAGESTEELAAAVRQAMEEARGSLASIVAPAEFNRFVERFVGEIVVLPDGGFAQKEPGRAFPHPTGDIAGGGFEPPTSGL